MEWRLSRSGGSSSRGGGDCSKKAQGGSWLQRWMPQRHPTWREGGKPRGAGDLTSPEYLQGREEAAEKRSAEDSTRPPRLVVGAPSQIAFKKFAQLESVQCW